MKKKKEIPMEDLQNALEGLKKLIVTPYEVFDSGTRLREIFSKADITLSKEEEQKLVDEFNHEINRLRTLMHRDELTGLYNRRGISEQFAALFKEALFEKENTGKRHGLIIKDFSIIFVEIDAFKEINEMYGRAEGDRVLVKLANVLNSKVRAVDAVGRLSGAQFVIALLGADEDAAYEKAEEIWDSLKKEVRLNARPELELSASFGVASLHQSRAETLMELVERAERSMYEAKVKDSTHKTVRYSDVRTQSQASQDSTQ